MLTQNGDIRRYNSLDLFKFIMAFLVIAIHTNPLSGLNAPPMAGSVYDMIVKIAVPFFFLASGYLLAGKFTEPLSGVGNIAAVKKQLIKILKMYLLWNVIYLPLAVYEYVKEDYSVIKAVVSYIRSFLFIGQHYNSWMLWYLLSTIFALVFVILLIRKNVPLKVIASIGFLFTLAGIGCDYLSAQETLPTVLELVKKAFSLTFSTGRIFSGMFYIPMGMVLRKKRLPLYVNIILFALFAALTCMTDIVYLRSILVLFYSVGFFGIVERINLKDSAVYPVMRKMSTNIYLIHMYVWFIFCMIFFKEERMGLLSFVCTSAISLVLSYLWIKLKPKLISKK